MSRIITILIINFVFVFSLYAQIPAGYYDTAEGLTGEDLRTALYNIIKGHNSRGYDDLWIDFQTTDKIGTSQVWDMYSIRADGSSNYVYNYTADQCGNYSGEGSCYNREHSFPKSWFGDASPMYTDLFHLYPTDGYTNGMRGNLPYGEVGTASWTSTNGSKRGDCVYPGYTSTVFEPIDEYKGDFARSYFYMLTRYKDVANTWTSDMLAGDNFSIWAKNMLLEWDAQDPVSQKEIDRNNAVYGIQNNRNPFIDRPEWGVAVWDPGSANINKKTLDNTKIWYTNQSINWSFSKNSKGVLEIYNVVGQKIESITIESKQSSIPLNLQKGVYVAEFKLEYHRVLKFIVD